MTMLEKLNEMEQMKRRNMARVHIMDNESDSYYTLRNKHDSNWAWMYGDNFDWDLWANYHMRPWLLDYEFVSDCWDFYRFHGDNYYEK